MKLVFRRAAPLAVVCTLAGLASTTFAPAASADDAGNPCGNFDFSSGIACKIEVSGGCTADCTPLKLEAGCKGGCATEVPPDAMCTTFCDSSCSGTCDPSAIDCEAGCHGECDQSMTNICMQQTPQADCVSQAKAQCDVHCQSSCSGSPANCPGQCQACCIGSCTGQINYKCDFQCFADLQGGCNVQCQQPAGALFCNGQYVHASDVEACISYLATQGVKVDVSARGSLTCDATGCHSAGGASVGACAVSEVGTNAGGSGIALAGVAIALAAARSRRRANPPRA
jgi:hypothetical protein